MLHKFAAYWITIIALSCLLIVEMTQKPNSNFVVCCKQCQMTFILCFLCNTSAVNKKKLTLLFLGLFSKAKGRFLGRDDVPAASASYSSQYSPQPVVAAPIWEPQEFG